MSRIQTRFQAAQTHHQNQRFAEAETLYQALLNDQPDHAESHHFLGLLYLQTQRPEIGLPHLKRAVELQPAHPHFCNNLGEALRRNGQLEAAQGCFETALKHNPDFVETRLNLALTLLEQSQPHAAQPHLEQVVKTQPQNLKAKFHLGDVYFKQQAWKPALDIYQSLLISQPVSAPLHFQTGQILEALQQFEQALHHYRQAYKYDPEYAEASAKIQALNQRLKLPTLQTIDFLICGVQKGGTTALSHFLMRHPEVCFFENKEADFFLDHDQFSGPDPVNYDWYHKQFHKEPQHRVVGEASPDYIYVQEAMGRIWSYHPQIKLIALFRNPVERAYSHWQMEVARGNETLDFSQAIRQETQRCRRALPYQDLIYSYLDKGFYAEQVRRILRYFPREQCLFLKNEDLYHHHDATLKQVFAFLGIDADVQVADQHLELSFRTEEGYLRSYASLKPKQARQQPLKAEDRAFLQRLYTHDIQQLATLLDWDLSAWLRAAE